MRRKPITVTCSAFLSAGGAIMAGASAAMAGEPECEPHWQHIPHGMQNATIHDMVVFDDGNGPALYVGGSFTEADNQPMDHIAKWDGTNWSSLGDASFTVRTLTVYDDGTGPALYANVWQDSIGKWTGSEWEQIGWFIGGFEPGELHTMTVWNEPGGESVLCVGGAFTIVDFRIEVFGLARWDGQSWSGVPDSGNYISAIAAYDSPHDAAGEHLYAGFNGLSWFDGQSWASIGLSGAVRALTVGPSLDDPNIQVLYVGGTFTEDSSGTPLNGVAQWDGQTLSPLGSGVTHATATTRVHALAVFDDGSGPALYAGGRFDTAGGEPANNIARWDGQSWTPLGNGVQDSGNHWETPVESIAAFSGIEGGALMVGGSFFGAPSNNNYLAMWQGCDHQQPCASMDLNCDGAVDVADLLMLLGAWGPCPGNGDCSADVNSDAMVDVDDLLILLANWA